MPDVELLDVPDGGHGLHVVVCEPVPGVHREAARAGVGGRTSQPAQCGVAAPPGTGVAAGVQLDRGNAEGGGAIDGARIGVRSECPMLSSSMSRMAATGCTLSYVSPCPACTARPHARAWAAARRSPRSAASPLRQERA